MKKKTSSLLVAMSLLVIGKAYANPMADLPANIKTYEAGAFNTMEQSQFNNYELEKSYIHSLEHVTKDESIYDASVEENVAREGVLYNPHFLLEKINFEGKYFRKDIGFDL